MRYKIIHNPEGKGNPYIQGPEERVPRFPSVKDRTVIGVVTEPADRDIELNALVSVNNNKPDIIKAEWLEDIGNYSSWRIKMPECEAYDRINYTLKIGKKGTESESFYYTVDGFSSVSSVISCRKNSDTFFIQLCAHNFNFWRAFEFSRSGRIRITLGDFVSSKTVSKAAVVNCSSKVLETGIKDYSITVDTGTGCISIKNKEGTPVYVETEPLEFRLNIAGFPVSFKNTISTDAEEKFYGFGERFNSINQRGNCLDVRVYEEYKSQDNGYRTYLPVPFFLSSGRWGHCINSFRKINYDLTEESSWTFEVEMENLDLECFFYLGEPSEILQYHAEQTGFPVLPPDWVFGPWMSSNEWNNQERVLQELYKSRALDIPATVLVVEAWSDEKTFYIWNDAQYKVKDGAEYFSYDDFTFPSNGLWPDPKKMIEDIHRDGTKLILWQIPVLRHLEENVVCEQNANDRECMIKNKYCVEDESGNPYLVKPWWFTDSLVIDFTSTEATEWWLKKREYLIDELGIDGFKTDGGEHLWGRGLKFSDGRTGSELWNAYPNYYIKSYFDFVNRKNNGITFSRSGFMGVQSSPVHWAGDQDSTWEAHRSVLKAVLNAGISGVPFIGWDIGGFSGKIPSAELYLRSTAFACFGSIMQYHSEFNNHKTPHVDRTPWNIARRTNSPQVINIYRYFAKLRMQLIPYIREEAEYCCKTGTPLMKLLFIDYPEDPECWMVEDQYKFGRDLLVCPVLYEGETERSIYLPEGEWYDFFSGEYFKGSRSFSVKTPLNSIPVFKKNNPLLENISLPEVEL